METSRRDLLAAGTVLTALSAAASAAGASAAPAAPPPGIMEVLHVYSDAEGISHARKVRVFGNKTIPVQSIAAGSIGEGVSHWGSAPNKRFSINTTGDIEVELGDGTRHRVGKGDLVFIEDMVGTGHRSHFLTPVANLFLIVDDDFDLLEWAGEAGDANSL